MNAGLSMDRSFDLLRNKTETQKKNKVTEESKREIMKTIRFRIYYLLAAWGRDGEDAYIDCLLFDCVDLKVFETPF
jgi:hypothetical protein